MIDVQVLFNRVNVDMVRKGIGGFSTNDQFNRGMNEASDILFEYWSVKSFQDQDVLDALMPFISSFDAVISAGTAAYPATYRRMLSIEYKKVDNSTGEPVIELIPMINVPQNQKRMAYRKPVKSDKKTYGYEFGSTSALLYPSELTGEVRFKYLRYPVTANRAVTVNVTTDDQDYTTVGTVQLEWPAHQLTNLVNIMLMDKGVEVQRTELTDFAAARMQRTAPQP